MNSASPKLKLFLTVIFFYLLLNGFAQHSFNPIDTIFEKGVDGKGRKKTFALPVFKVDTLPLLIYRSKFSIDADGSPKAYNPQDTGIDFLSSARQTNGKLSPKVILFQKDKPVLQKDSDPMPGYYVTKTTLYDKSIVDTAIQSRYVNAEEIPFFVIPHNKLESWSIPLGSYGYIFNIENKTGIFAIFADEGPINHIGEGSVKLAQLLGLKSVMRKGKRTLDVGVSFPKKSIVYLIVQNSGSGNVQTSFQIQEAFTLLDAKYNLRDIVADFLK